MRFQYLLLPLVLINTISLSKQSNIVNLKFPPKHQDHRRIKRTTDAAICTNLTSCAGRCSGTQMFHDIEENKDEPSCYCDRECDKVFADCCADYIEKCGTPKKIPAKKIHKEWTCFSRKEFPYEIWMISGCKLDWPKNDSNVEYCTLFSETTPKVSWITPVFGVKTTYRNRYCALCNGVTKFKTWKIEKIECKIELPQKYTEEQKVKHYDKYCDASSMKFKTQTRGIRYCYDVETTCKYYHDKEACMDCKLGTTGLLSSDKSTTMRSVRSTYKNFGCLICNRKMNEKPVNVTCGPRNGKFIGGGRRYEPVPFSHIFQGHDNSRVEPGSTTNQKPKCALHQVYDNAAKLCRNLFVHNATTSNNFLKQFAVRLTFEQTKATSCSNQIINITISSYIQKSFLTSLREKFDLYSEKILQNASTQWRFHDLDVHLSTNNTLVTFRILRARSLNETIEADFFTEELKIGKVEVNLMAGGHKTVCVYVLRKVETREAVCLDNETFPVNVEDLKTRNGSIYMNITEYKSGEYMLYQYLNETRIALCRDWKPIYCLYHLQVKNRTHWKEFTNRSIYSLVTKSWFHYGEYSLVNGSLWLCLTKNHTRQTYSTLVNTRSIHYTILGYSTTVSLAVSITSLAVLLVVYSMFSSLRNLPGKNLMLFSAILALAQTSWLVQNEIASRWPGLCPTINVVMQFLFLASFSCSFSIAVHSFLTFNALSKGKLRQKSKGGLFLKYAMVGLGLPFLYVVGCLILDTNNVVPFNYGTSDGHCWFGSTNILYIGFLYPAFVLLLCNMILFFATLRVIYKCTKASQKLAEKTGGANRKHVGVYIRMSTVMGFTWLSAVFNIFFPNVVVFQYIFVFVNGFQGFYLSFAFLSTANVRKIVLGRSGKKMRDNITTSDGRIKREISTTNM